MAMLVKKSNQGSTKRMGCDWDFERYYLMISVGKGRKLEELDMEELELTLGGMRGGITSLFRAGLRVVPTFPDDEVRLFCLYMVSGVSPL